MLALAHAVANATPESILSLILPAEARVLPVEIGNVLCVHACEGLVDVDLVALLVVALEPEEENDAEDKDRRGCGQVDSVTDAGEVSYQTF
jgi:hypothetical protein